jgi:predicted transposase/invertase (TIGR01784 family)
MSRYINPFTDFGFKRLFGSEAGKESLKHFLNEILPEGNHIEDLNFRKTEHLGQNPLDRKVVYDLYCENEKGEKFIVEIQKAKQIFFKDRALYYSTFPIQEQAERGDWNYELKAVFTVAILDFVFESSHSDVKTEVRLMDTVRKVVFYDKLTYIFLQMPNFKKTAEELENLQDKWFYLLKNLANLENRPKELQERIFDYFFSNAELAQLKPEDRVAYEDSLKYYRDVKNSLETAFEEGLIEGEQIGLEKGKIEGKIEGKTEVALNMLRLGLDISLITDATGLREEEIKKLRK